MEAIEENTNVDTSIVTPKSASTSTSTSTSTSSVKIKKPRSEKQIEAFKKCAERRKQKLLEKNNNVSIKENAPATSFVNNDILKGLYDQIAELKNQVTVVNKRSNRIEEPDNMETERIQTEQVPQQQRQHQLQQQPTFVGNLQSQNHTATPIGVGLGLGLGIGMGNGYNVSGRNKRDIRGMDPYADERQGMIEKVYARNVNYEKQRELDRMNHRRYADENSIQLLNHHRDENEMEVDSRYTNRPNIQDNDRRGSITSNAENMSSMIRTGSNTTQARRISAIAVNGLRVASRR